MKDGDTIEIDDERMRVTGVANVATGIWNLTVTRAVLDTTKAAHDVGRPVQKVHYPT